MSCVWTHYKCFHQLAEIKYVAVPWPLFLLPPRLLGQSETLRDRETRDRDKTETKGCRGRDKTKTTKKWSTSLASSTTLPKCRLIEHGCFFSWFLVCFYNMYSSLHKALIIDFYFHKCKDFLFFSVSYHYKLNIYNIWTVWQTFKKNQKKTGKSAAQSGSLCISLLLIQHFGPKAVFKIQGLKDRNVVLIKEKCIWSQSVPHFLPVSMSPYVSLQPLLYLF